MAWSIEVIFWPDRTVCHLNGGNTSANWSTGIIWTGWLLWLWVKAPAGTWRPFTGQEFAGLRLDEIVPLLEQDAMTDEEMSGTWPIVSTRSAGRASPLRPAPRFHPGQARRPIPILMR